MSALHPTAVLLLRRLRTFWSRILAARLVEKQKSQSQSFTTELSADKARQLLCTAQHWDEVFAKLSPSVVLCQGSESLQCGTYGSEASLLCSQDLQDGEGTWEAQQLVHSGDSGHLCATMMPLELASKAPLDSSGFVLTG